MKFEAQSCLAHSVRNLDPDWLDPTADDGEALLLQCLDDLVNWSGGLAVCSAEREPTPIVVSWRSFGNRSTAARLSDAVSPDCPC
jgi:hypothetical protein